MTNVIKLARVRRGFSQSELAEMLGVSQATISLWEKGRAMPNTRRLPAVANALGISVEAFFGGQTWTGS